MPSKLITIPLFNFELTDTRVCKLGTDRIEKANTKQIEESKGPYYYAFNLKVMPGNDNDEDYRQAFNKGIITLKLFKDEFILADFYQLPDRDLGVRIFYFIPWGRVIDRRYSISLRDKRKLRRFWEDLQDIDTKNFAVSRFHLAEYRPKDNDRFLDYVLALEFLLVPMVKTEIAYQFRLSGALCLGKHDNLSIQKRFELLNCIYDLRSRIVHGEPDIAAIRNLRKLVVPNESEKEREAILTNKNERLKWRILIETIRTYVREAILLFYKEKDSEGIRLLDNNDDRRKWIKGKILKSS